jgi:hypothetical protein
MIYVIIANILAVLITAILRIVILFKLNTKSDES